MVQFQKLKKNLLLTPTGALTAAETVQDSQALQMFAPYAYRGAAGPISKMASQQEKASCVLRLEVSRSLITEQREFRALFKKKMHHTIKMS
jgi:hypothetical protein